MSNLFTSKLITTILLTWVVQVLCSDDRAKIRTSGGNLYLEPARGKSIYFRTNGPQSAVFLDDVSLINVTSRSYSPSHIANTDIDTNIITSDDVLKRLQALESRNLVTNEDFVRNISSLSLRISRISARLSRLQRQLEGAGDKCELHSCQNGGTCLNLVGDFHCLCPPNWEGRNCEIDVNECRNFAGTDLGCQNGADCVNKPGSYECQCRVGWFGTHCTRRKLDCSAGNFEMCGHGTCVPVGSGEGIKCICDQGWTTNGSFACLTDVNECDTSLGARCSTNPKVECINLPGSFRCGQCPQGFQGDGYVCYDIDECATSNGGCSSMVSCHNTIGSRICGACPPGYVGDGVTCSWKGSCSIDNGGCHPSARCTENPGLAGGIQCECPQGMNGDGFGIDGCYVSTNNRTRSCEGAPCGANGRCHRLRNGYTCVCLRGYGGAHCDVRTRSCAINLCRNGGVCKPDDTAIWGFQCECTAQYTGTLCQERSRCGSILRGEEGNLMYPPGNVTSGPTSKCAWIIRTVPEKVINVTFTRFNLERSPDCNFDFLQLHDGRSTADPLIGRFCGDEAPKGGHILSNQHNLYLWFVSNSGGSRNVFSLHWNSVAPVCGGVVNATTHGSISSPGSPGKYPPNRDCYWHLTTTLGKRIQLHFFQLDLEIHDNCSFDYLAIYDGHQLTDPLLERYCSSTQPAPLLSTGPEMFIHFHSDAHGNGKGFQITYAPAEGVPGCGGVFSGDRGEVSSPSYDGSYLNNLLCEYKIRTGPDTQIQLNFRLFKLERSRYCRRDYLKIYDGSSTESPIIGTYCGELHRKIQLNSTSNTMLLVFRSDRSRSGEGFKISYQAICKYFIRGDSGVIKSPGYPFTYPDNRVCEYVIETSPGKAIQLAFQDFDIEGDALCRYDNVEIRDGLNSNSSLIGKYCGNNIPPTRTSSHNIMYVRFNSDMSQSGGGFYANYTVINIECGGIYRESSGTIVHPTLNGKYKNLQSCTWIILAPAEKYIHLSWNTFRLEYTNKCTADYLQVSMIDNDDDVPRKLCGNSMPPSMTMPTNSLKLKFVSDFSQQDTGFSVTYSLVDQIGHCGGSYVLDHGMIYSPGWPNHYSRNLDCVWVISVTTGHQIKLNMSQFDLERPSYRSRKCEDFLKVTNGPSALSPLIGEYCGSFDWKSITSTANSLRLHFHSDFLLGGKGFKIEWDSTVTGCGGTFTGHTGTISSPNYPSDYDENVECFYRIVTSQGSRISINFPEFHLESLCDDFVEIFDGRDPESPMLGRFCRRPTTHIETTSNYAFIKFKSDFAISEKGFLLNYNTICNNTVTGYYGVIESLNYPNSYPAGLNCTWLISVPKGNKINVTFTNFDIRYRNYLWSYSRDDNLLRAQNHLCTLDYVSINEPGQNSGIKKLCGTQIPNQISITGNLLNITFVAKASSRIQEHTGFRLEWLSYGCRGHIKKSSGSLNKTLSSSDQVDCEWLLETPEGTSIKLTFSKLYMVETNNCTTDAIEVYNGPNDQSPILTRMCHISSDSHIDITSSSNYALVKLVKKSSLKDVHFAATFTKVNVVCGGDMRTQSGTITSKNYPKNYDNNLECFWFIRVPDGHRISLNFTDIDLSNEHDSCDDSIKLYYSVEDTIEKNYTHIICDKSAPKKYFSEHNTLVIKFQTNDIDTAKGFKVNFEATCGGLTQMTKDVAYGVITNDNYMSHSNSSCIWTILAPKLEQKVSLTITHLSLPITNDRRTNQTCPNSYLRVLDGDDEDAPLIDEYCGRAVPATIVSRGSALTVQLGTHADRITGLFSASFSTVDAFCGGTFTSEAGVIASPNYPSPYPVSAVCEWTLKTSPGNRVAINIEMIDISYSEECNEDYLEVRKNDGAGKILGLYCGNILPVNTTSASQLYIKFHSDDKNPGRGFLINYSFLHGNDITDLNEGEIASPLYPRPYDGSGEFWWRVTSGNEAIVIEIDELQITSHSELCDDNLSIYDGHDNEATLLKKLCGALHKTVEIIRTTSNAAYIKLTLNEANNGALFHLRWSRGDRDIDQMIDKPNCGSNSTVLVMPEFFPIISSPNYPKPYNNDLNCEWVFKASYGRHLSLTFTDFDIEEREPCTNGDTVSIFESDVPAEWRPIKVNMCLNSDIQQKFNASKYMKVIFRSDSSYARPGFTGHVKSECGAVLNDPSGIIAISELEFGTPSCDWKVRVRPGRRIKLEFVNFKIVNENNNCQTYIVIHNGDSKESPKLSDGKYCGFSHENKSTTMTSSNNLFVSYINIGKRNKQSFSLHYEEVHINCGVTSKLNADHPWEIISSPNYPNVPDPYSECNWLLTAPLGEILRVDFIDRFDVYKEENCLSEFVEIRDGASSVSPLKGHFCGETPSTIKTTSNSVFINYVTERAEPNNGFKANVSINVCGGTISASQGEITSPGYPNSLHLPPGTVCEWHIIGVEGKNLLITSQEMNLPESESNCGTKVTIEEIEPVGKTKDILRTYCSYYSDNDLSVVESSDNKVTVKLHIGVADEFSESSSGFRLTFKSSRSGCSNTFTTSEGYITSPRYPKIANTRFCSWSIEVPDRSRRITLEILDVASKSHLFISEAKFAKQIASIINNDKTSNNSTFKSSGNKMEIVLQTPRSGLRFKAKFSSREQSICGGPLTGLIGEIKSPDKYDSYFCKWNYLAVSNVLENDNNDINTYKSILITGNIHSSNDTVRMCRHFGSKINIDFNIDKYKTVGQIYCNEEINYLVPHTNVVIEATKESSHQFNFSLQWILQPCGGIINVANTPKNILNIKQPYNDTVHCAWLLQSEISDPIEIKLEGNFQSNCADEFVKVGRLTNGYFENNRRNLFHYCKDEKQNVPVTTSLSMIFIEYHVKVPNSSNMKLFVRSVPKSCGGRFFRPDQFSSPNFPRDYDSNVECEWDIFALERGFRVSLRFVNRFAIEKSPNCTKDSVIIYDWKDGNYIEIAKLCGRELPPVFNSTYDRLKVVLRTDNETNLDGFQADWTTICGGTYNATTTKQYLYSPGYPFYYPSKTCVYKILAPSEKLNLNFLTFDLEGYSGACENDNLTISSSSNQLYFYEIYCGNQKPEINVMFSYVDIVFNSDSSVQKLGFKMAYSIYSCGGHITQPTTISSGTHNSYNNNMNCTWLIDAPSNKKIVLKIDYFQVEQSYQCMNDYLAVYEGPNTDVEKRLALICGDIPSSTAIPSVGNTMTVEFITDGYMQMKGFKVDVIFTYSESVGCGGVVNLTSSAYNLSSPHINSQYSYENFLDCHWKILAPLDRVIKVSFSSFHIAPCLNVNQTALGVSKCDCDFVQIKDGVTPDSLTIGTYCGHDLPADVISSGNTISVRLSTDGEQTSLGFTAILTVQESACGQTLFNVSRNAQRVKSPGYNSGSIARGIHCLYHFVSASSYELMHIHFNDFDLQSGTNDCDADKIIISSITLPIGTSLGKDYIQGANGGSTLGSSVFSYYSISNNATTPEQYMICGSKKSVDLYVTGSFAMNVITSSEGGNRQYRGIDVEVSRVGFCGRNFTELYARVANNYEFDLNKTVDDCYTLISVPDNYTISIYFNTYTASPFSNAYLDIHDGNTTAAPKLITYSKDNLDYAMYPLYSTGNSVLLHNHLSGLEHIMTYDITYMATDKGKGCGGYFYGAEGTLTSPLYPSVYREAKTCEWVLETPHGTRLSLQFETFDLRKDCDHNYVQLLDRAGESLASYCSETPAVFTSEDNYVKIIFVTSRNNGGTGWVAKFVSVL